MSDSDGPMPEGEMRRLLADAPTHVLSASQRARLRARLGLDVASVDDERTTAGPGRVQDISAASPTARRVWGRAGTIAAAAAVVIVVGIVALVGNRGNSSDELHVADIGEVTRPTGDPDANAETESSAARLCREEIASFAAGIETWAGVENWAFLTDRRRPAPDLLDLAAAAVAGIGAISDSQEITDVRIRLDELIQHADVADVATGTAAFELSRSERDDYRRVVERAAEGIADSIEREGWGELPGCT